jgi:hypothetical protein
MQGEGIMQKTGFLVDYYNYFKQTQYSGSGKVAAPDEI